MAVTRVIFTLADFEFDPDVITNSTGVNPTRVVRKGTLKFPGKSPVQWKENAWVLEAEPLSGTPEMFKVQLDEIFSILATNWEKFVKLGQEYFCEITCVLRINIEDSDVSSLPSIHLEQEDVRRLVQLNAEFDIDAYLIGNVGG